ncbi:hypothetical protein Poly41_12420 [Novipirellula artificiosorum]|uniref:DUF58 domain-containing protein n=2 Tax=Novipirellula artificiosorum TaxID=2528016 RepID=A0A5C6DUP8_9BACT|nr:hypothetical protein Poly41_12420 [Novipirellula artificiosorum]
MLGGALRGFNLLLVVAGLIIGALLMQWRWARSACESMSLERQLPDEVFAGQSLRIHYQVANHNRWLTIWLLGIEDRVSVARSGVIQPMRTSLSKIRRGATLTVPLEMVATERGQLTFGPSVLSTSFPLDLLAARIEDKRQPTQLVYPRLFELKRGWQRLLSSRHGGMSNPIQRSGRSEGDFMGLREYRIGDKLRWIHWRTTARMDEPVVCQYDQPRRYDLCLLVDAYLPTPHADDGHVEDAISVAATIVVQLAAVGSNRIVLAIAGRDPVAAPASGSIESQRRLLAMLARAEATKNPLFADAMLKARSTAGRFRDMVVISPRSIEDAMSELPEQTGAQLGTWLRRGALRWVNVSDPQSSPCFHVS